MFPSRVHEYPFPVKRSDLSGAPVVPAHFEATFDKSVEDVAVWLSDSLAPIQSPIVTKLRDVVLRYRPLALASTSERWFLKLVRVDAHPPLHHALFLHARPSAEQLRSSFDRFNIRADQAILDFFGYLPGLRTHAAWGTAFFSASEWSPFKNLGWYEEEDGMDPNREWAESAMIYSGGGGSWLLLNSFKQLAWGVTESSGPDRLVPLKLSFDEFLSNFASSLNRGIFPNYEFK